MGKTSSSRRVPAALRWLESRKRSILRPLTAWLSAWFMPVLCVHCRGDRWAGTPLCRACLRKASPLRPPVCPACGLTGCGDLHGEADPALASLRFLFRMGPQLSTLIHGFKYRHMRRHIPFLCAYLRYRPDLLAWSRGFDALVPVPIHRIRKRERGYNQAREIALAASGHLGLPVLDRALIRIRPTTSQTKLNRQDRRGNLGNAFACAEPGLVRGKRILLVDDVFTTGATAGRCAELLRAAGAVEVGVLALAKVEISAGLDDFALEMEAVSSYAG